MWLKVDVQAAPFDLACEESALLAQAGDAGAVVAFVGRVRAHDAAVPLSALWLEHFPGVTEAEIARIAALAADRWPVTACRVIHRVGALAPGEGIVLVLMASPHRAAAFEAAAYLMDYLKTEAPFWKREDMADGSHRWVEARQTDEAARARWES